MQMADKHGNLSNNPDKSQSYWCLVLTASLSLFNFGYNTSSIGGALLYIGTSDDTESCLSESVCLRTAFEKGCVVSSCLLGAVFGALIAGHLAELRGPRTILLFNNVSYILGPLGMALAPNIGILICARAFTGVGVGVSSALVTVYVSEIVPASRRGEYGAITAMMTTVGILLAFLASVFLADSWRVLLGASAVPAMVQSVLGLFVMPESPRWLQKQVQHERELQVGLLKGDTRLPVEAKRTGWVALWGALRSRRTAEPLIVGVGLQMFQQICGVNVTVYYSPQVFTMLHCSKELSDILSAIITCLSILSTFMIARIVDVIGRRRAGFIGISVMSASLVALAAAFLAPQSLVSGWVAALAILSYRVAFGMSLGPLPYIVTAEIFSDSWRAAGASLCWASNWTCNFIVSLTFLPLVNLISASGAFLLYTGACVASLWFLCAFVPETTGQELAKG